MPKNNQNSDQEQLLKEITSFLEKAKIPYMVTGSLSVIFYGRPRSSHDIDFVIEAKAKDLEKIKEAFKQLPDEFLKDIGDIENAVLNRKSFNLLHLPTYLKLDFWLLKDDKFDKERFGRRKNIKVFGQKMSFASPEDTILMKLLWYKETKIEKHLIDAAFVYQIQEKNLDKQYLKVWTKKQKTQKFLEELRKVDLSFYY